jgi:hypothetical protein
VTSRRLLEHIEHLESPRFHNLWQLHASDERVIYAACGIASLEQFWDRHEKAEEIYVRALAVKEKALGPDHTSSRSQNSGPCYMVVCIFLFLTVVISKFKILVEILDQLWRAGGEQSKRQL